MCVCVCFFGRRGLCSFPLAAWVVVWTIGCGFPFTLYNNQGFHYPPNHYPMREIGVYTPFVQGLYRGFISHVIAGSRTLRFGENHLRSHLCPLMCIPPSWNNHVGYECLPGREQNIGGPAFLLVLQINLNEGFLKEHKHTGGKLARSQPLLCGSSCAPPPLEPTVDSTNNQ